MAFDPLVSLLYQRSGRNWHCGILLSSTILGQVFVGGDGGEGRSGPKGSTQCSDVAFFFEENPAPSE